MAAAAAVEKSIGTVAEPPSIVGTPGPSGGEPSGGRRRYGPRAPVCPPGLRETPQTGVLSPSITIVALTGSVLTVGERPHFTPFLLDLVGVLGSVLTGSSLT